MPPLEIASKIHSMMDRCDPSAMRDLDALIQTFVMHEYYLLIKGFHVCANMCIVLISMSILYNHAMH